MENTLECPCTIDITNCNIYNRIHLALKPQKITENAIWILFNKIKKRVFKKHIECTGMKSSFNKIIEFKIQLVSEVYRLNERENINWTRE